LVGKSKLLDLVQSCRNIVGLGVCEIVIPSISWRRWRRRKKKGMGDKVETVGRLSGKLTTLDLLPTKSLTLSKLESGTGESLCLCVFVYL